MTPKVVERLLTQDARLLARRDSPVLDKELETQRQVALNAFFQWQDGEIPFTEVVPLCVVLQRRVELNRALLKWERWHQDQQV